MPIKDPFCGNLDCCNLRFEPLNEDTSQRGCNTMFARLLVPYFRPPNGHPTPRISRDEGQQGGRAYDKTERHTIKQDVQPGTYSAKILRSSGDLMVATYCCTCQGTVYTPPLHFLLTTPCSFVVVRPLVGEQIPLFPPCSFS